MEARLRVEILRKDNDFILGRCVGEGAVASTLVLEPASDQPPARIAQMMEHEFALRMDLDSAWAARPLSIGREQGRLLLTLEDPGGEPLTRFLGRPLEPDRFLPIALQLAEAIAKLHAQGLIHRDIKPDNVLVNAANGAVSLTGFGIASRLARHTRGVEPPESIVGTLAYMAPEQTGRMNRSVDSRSDLYSYGVTLYEMLTGALPFADDDPMEVVYSHVARVPIPPARRVPKVPEAVSAIVTKLLAKNPEDRYQTATGVAADVKICLTRWESTRLIDPFPLGSWDGSDQLRIPEKLYGREREIEALIGAFDRVVSSGTTEVVLVSGDPGVGKSSLVNELQKAVVLPRGLFAFGKFDQLRRDIPYTTLAQAFRSLVRQLLAWSAGDVADWPDKLRSALGENRQLAVNLIPELELVIGTQSAIVELPAQDSERRFQETFRRLLGAFARPEHPLALFLDDLQWLDVATLKLLEHVATNPEITHLLIVGAYRHNEIGLSHPLKAAVGSIHAAGARVQEIALAPLPLDQLEQLVADSLHCAPVQAAPLAQLVHERTAGNPFFVIEFLTGLADEGLLAFDARDRSWRWDANRIRAQPTKLLEQLLGRHRQALQPFHHQIEGTIGRAYLGQARSGFLRWGPHGEMAQLDGLPSLREEHEAGGTSRGSVENLDVLTLVKASQAVSGEPLLERLVETLLRITVQHAGAERGLLIVPQGTEARIETEASIAGDALQIACVPKPATSADLPLSVMHLARRTRQSVVVEDASSNKLLADDPYVKHRQVRSILCMPLLKQSKLIGVLYLESTVAARVFTSRQLAMVELIATQAAISLDDVRLHANLAGENAARRSAEAVARGSEARNAAILKTALDCIITMDAEGRITEFNPAAERTFQLTRAEAVGQTLEELIIPPSLRERHREGLKRYLATREGPVLGKRLELTALHADGTEFPVELAIVALPGEGPPTFTGYLRDITERKNAKAALEQRLRFERLISDLSAAFTHVRGDEVDGHIQTWLGRIGEFLTLDRVSIFRYVEDIAMFQSMYHWIRPGILPPPPVVFASEFPVATGLLRNNEMFRYARESDMPDGDRAAYRKLGTKASLGLPLSIGGSVVGVMVLSAVRSEREWPDELVERLRGISEIFANAFARKQADEDKRIQVQLAQALEFRERVMGILGHDLSNPLTAITGLTQTILNRSGLPDDILRRVSVIDGAARRMIEMIGTLLDFTESRFKGSLAIVRAQADLVDVVTKAIDELRAAHPGRIIHLDAYGPARGEWDAARMQQVISNLVANAIAHGGRDTPVRVSVAEAEKEIMVLVHNLGSVIPPEFLPKIFDPFEQGQRNALSGSRSVGLGLYIVRQIVLAHGGTIKVESTVEKGTCFTVCLPRKPLA